MENFESQSWYRAAHLKPRLVERVEISRQIFRGQPWFVVRDPLSGKFCRLSEAAYTVAGLMNGNRKLGEIWDITCAELGDDAPSQDELLATVSQLNSLDLLVTDGLPDPQAIAARGARLRRRGLIARFLNPLAVRVPLFDPDQFLNEVWPLARPIFTIWGALAYCTLLIAGGVTAATNWDELTGNLIDRILAAESILILLLVYPVVKALHELGHGFAVKKWGGEVREMGVMFLVFIPVPYVDASASSAFSEKGQRMLVGAAGILVELGLAAVAMLIWTELEGGIWRAVCFNVMLIGGLSTLFFNGNPLLRFDGYYVLTDATEIPNLGSRSNRYLGYLIQRYLFGIEQARNPKRADGEPNWFVVYSISAFVYRLFISFAIITLVATQFFALGVILAIWAMCLMFLLPLAKHLRFVAANPILRGNRGRAVVVISALFGAVTAFFSLVPLPYRTVADGVVHAPDHSVIYAGETGQVADVLALPNAPVTAGEPLIRLSDPLAETQLGASRAEARKYRARFEQSLSENAFDVRLWRAQADRASREAEVLEKRIGDLVVRAPRDGIVVMRGPDDFYGRWLKRGEVVGHVIDPAELVIRVAVPQVDADIIRRRTRTIDLRPAENLNQRNTGRIVREVPTIGGELASLALSVEGGGAFSLEPGPGPADEKQTPRAVEPVMHFDVKSEGGPVSTTLGTRVYVRFDHGSEPLAGRVWRRVRQIFLKRFNV